MRFCVKNFMSKGDIERYSKILHLIIEEGIKWEDWKKEAHQTGAF
jgi:hypothetical protein